MKIDLSEVNNLLVQKEYKTIESIEIQDNGDVLIYGTHSSRFSPLVKFTYNLTTKKLTES